MLSNRRWWRTNLLYYSLLFLILALCMFVPYWLTGTSLVWQSDGITQHVPALAQWQLDLKNLFETGMWPTQWNWQIGLGADYYQTFSYYTLGDIFSYGVGLVSTQHLLAYFEGMVIVRLFLAGIAILWAIKYFTKSTNPWINTLVAVSYVFTGYTAFAAFEHPFFINPLIIMPLLFVSFDYLLTQKKMMPFTLMVFWTLWNNYYFAFMLLLGLIIYWLIHTWLYKQWSNWRLHLRVIISGIIGALMAMVLFLPNVLGVLASSRSGAPLANGLVLYPLYYYLALPGTLLGNTATPNFWFTGGFATILILGLIYVLRHWRDYRMLASLFVIAGVGLLIPAFAGIFNGGSSPSNRWTFLLALPLALAAVHFMTHLTKKDWRWFYVTGLIMSLSLFITTGFSFQTPFGLLIALYFVTLLILQSRNIWSTHTSWFILTGVTLLNLIVVIGHNHELDLNPDKSSMLSRVAVQQLLNQQQHYPSETTTDQLSLQRSLIADPLQNMKGIAPGNNLAMLSPAHSIDSYWSYQNGDVGRFMSSLGILTSTNNDVTSDLNHRSQLANILGVQQAFQNEDDPSLSNYRKIGVTNKQTHMLSTYAYPLAYVAPNVVSSETYAQATPSQREAFLVDSVVTDEIPERLSDDAYRNQIRVGQISQHASDTPKETVHYTYKTKPDTEHTGFYITADPALANTELHLELSNIRFSPATFTESYNADLAAYTFDHNEQDIDMRYNPAAFKWSWYKQNIGNIGTAMDGYSITANYAGNKQKFSQTSKKNLSFYNPRTTATLNLGPAKNVSEKQFVPLQFSQPGQYTFDVQLVALPTDQRFTAKAVQIQKQAVPLKLEANQITGQVTQKTSALVTTSIPFSKGWHSRSHELVKVNHGFLGIKANAGVNNIELTYETPGLRLGLILSLIGVLLFLGLIFYEYRSNRTHKHT